MKTRLLAIIAVLFVFPSAALPAAGLNVRAAVICPQETSPLETLAAREIQRYVYLRTGELPPILTAKPRLRFSEDAIIVGRKDRDHAGAARQDQQLRAAVAALQAQQYVLKTIQAEGRRTLLVVGDDDVGRLYGAYPFAGCLGARFYLRADELHRLPLLPGILRPLYSRTGGLDRHERRF